MKSPAVVRIATPADEDAVYRLLLGLERDNGIGFRHDEDRVRGSIREGTERRGGIVAVIDAPDQPGEIAGSIGVHWGQFWYSHQHYLAETWLFVAPQYRRGTGYADALMQYASWIKATFNKEGAPELPFFTAVTTRKRLAAKRRWWCRRGEEVGAIFLLR